MIVIILIIIFIVLLFTSEKFREFIVAGIGCGFTIIFVIFIAVLLYVTFGEI